MATSEDDYSDLTELGIDINEKVDPLTEKFNLAAQRMQTLASQLNNETLLKMYAYYKQSLEGPCCTPKPSWYDMRGKAKWEAWKALGDMSQLVAKDLYIQSVIEIDPLFEPVLINNSQSDQQMSKETWVKVSSFLIKNDCEDSSSDTKNDALIEYIRDNNLNEVTKCMLKLSLTEINSLAHNNMGLIHWAADSGNKGILELILNAGADINLQDNDGQTALHFAASCGNLDCLEVLLNRGARIDLNDNDGCTPLDVASDDSVKELLSNTR